MSELEKFVRDGGHLVKNESNLWYDSEEEYFIVMIDWDSTDESSFESSLDAGYYFTSLSFEKAYAELQNPDSQESDFIVCPFCLNDECTCDEVE